ncbi:MAG: LytTR family DNA-binding domain-containing protein [Hespellia sp.]|nr:LytTR family DNA-binding domain-containing protein [Hespellia sp.]
MIKVAVVDDEKMAREQLETYFFQMSSALREEIDVQTYVSGDELLEAYDYSMDIICLDIQMQGQDGITTAKKIREKDDQVILIFVTNMAQLAIEGYAVRALDFILKPINYYSFQLKMQSVVKSVIHKKVKTLVFNHEGSIIRIVSEELYYVEVEDHYISYHTAEAIFRQKASLKELEEKLEGLSFKRCNNCYLINLKHVRSVRKDEVLVGGNWLKISRPRKKEFLQALANYMGGFRV